VGSLGTLAAALLISSIVVVPSASAAPRDLQQVRDQVRTLQAKAEAATERFNKARNELSDVQATLDGLKKKVKREREELQQVLSSVDDLARNTYTSGGLDTSLQVLLADDPNQFLAQAAALDQVAQAQASSLRRTQTARLRLAQSEAAVSDKESIARKYRNEMASAKKEADKAETMKASVWELAAFTDEGRPTQVLALVDSLILAEWIRGEAMVKCRYHERGVRNIVNEFRRVAILGLGPPLAREPIAWIPRGMANVAMDEGRNMARAAKDSSRAQ